MDNNTTQLTELLRCFCLKRICDTEDFATAEGRILDDLFVSLTDAMGHALEDFDDALLKDKERAWHVKDKRFRTILTEFGDVTFARRIYIDECADRRSLLDEILAIRPRKRLSPGAFESLAYFGGEIPYGRAAKTCFRHCQTKVSPMTTLATLREVGDLLEKAARQARHSLFSDGIIPDAEHKALEICVEDDGIWVPLQGEGRRSVEIKALCAYQNKSDGRRMGCTHYAAVAKPKRFFEEAIAYVGRRYALDRIRRIWAGSDGGGWDKTFHEYFPTDIEITHKLDPWHLNRAIKVAWPDKADQKDLFELLYQGDIDGLLSVLRLRADTGFGDRDKTRALITYIENHYTSIVVKSPSLGTMESTNAHLYAARMKAFGGAWSIEGASDMARIRSRVFSGDDLPAPKREQAFGPRDIRRRDKVRNQLLDRINAGVQSVGEGYEPPCGSMPILSVSQTARELRAFLNRE